MATENAVLDPAMSEPRGKSPAPKSDSGHREAENRRLLTRLSIIAVMMFGFGFALVPFYDRICAAFGIDRLTEKSEAPANTQIDLSRKVSIEFDSNTTQDLPWRFRPVSGHLNLHPGELVQVEYEVTNVRNVPVTGQAVPSYAPSHSAAYFKKLDCFCFTRQTLAPHETRRMPVVFAIDPALPADVHTVTLSYTFFLVPGG